MSIQSKARRDARKRREQRERNRAQAGRPPIEPHADLRDGEGNLLAGIVRQSGVWVLGMDGRIVGSSDSAAQVLMLIHRARRLHEDKGIAVRLSCSEALSAEAELEAAANGKSLADYQQQLEGEMAAAQPVTAGESAS